MIHIKTDEEIELMRQTSRLAAEVLLMIEPYVKPGVSTTQLDKICHDFIVSRGGLHSPLNSLFYIFGHFQNFCAVISSQTI